MNAVEWQDELTYDNIYYKRETDRVEDLYWPLNRVRLAVQPAAEAQLDLWLETFTPNFSHFRITFEDGRAVFLQSGLFQWKLHPGINGVEIAAVNQWGISGSTVNLLIDWPVQSQM